MEIVLYLYLLTSNPDLFTLSSSPGRQQQSTQAVRVTATAYCLKGRMSNDEKTHHGCIALSRDLVRHFKARFGDTVVLPGIGSFIFKDLMPPQWRRRVDIWLPSKKACWTFGVRRSDLYVVRSNKGVKK